MVVESFTRIDNHMSIVKVADWLVKSFLFLITHFFCLFIFLYSLMTCIVFNIATIIFHILEIVLNLLSLQYRACMLASVSCCSPHVQTVQADPRLQLFSSVHYNGPWVLTLPVTPVSNPHRHGVLTVCTAPSKAAFAYVCDSLTCKCSGRLRDQHGACFRSWVVVVFLIQMELLMEVLQRVCSATFLCVHVV